MIVRTQLQSLEAPGWVTKAELKKLLSFKQTRTRKKNDTKLGTVFCKECPLPSPWLGRGHHFNDF